MQDLPKRSKEVEVFAGKLKAFDRVEQEAERLLGLEEAFFCEQLRSDVLPDRQ
jgi:hypothetical protein